MAVARLAHQRVLAQLDTGASRSQEPLCGLKQFDNLRPGKAVEHLSALAGPVHY
jgi:hypothetical protein